jgi:acyl dehydratase/acyl carrier protein
MTLGGAPAPWTVTADDHAWFTTFSGDANPIHADPVASRRLLGGRMLVHGAHLLLRALEHAAAAGAITTVPAAISVVFRDGVGIGDQLVTRFERADGDRIDVSIERAGPPGATVATIRVEEGAGAVASDRIDLFEPDAGPPERPSGPRTLSVDDLATMVGTEQPSLLPAVDAGACRARFPAITALLGAGRVAELAAISCVIGMLTPGRSSMSSAYDITLHAPTGDQAMIGHRIDHVDPRMRRVRLTVHGTSMRAAVTAFSPPAPVDQAAVLADGGDAPVAGEFAGWRALVVGGSRGLGEATVRLLVAGGADVRFTWCAGPAEAARLAADVGVTGLRWCAPDDDIAAALPDDWRPTHVCWFASPASSGDPDAAAIEVEAFERAVAGLPDPPLVGVLWPSIELLDHPDAPSPPGTAERVQRALAGEAACDRLAASRPRVGVRAARLPTLLTDRTQTLLPREYGDTATVLLAALRALPSPTPGRPVEPADRLIPSPAMSDDALIAVFADGLGLAADQLDDETSPVNTPAWDSLASMTLVSLVEERFGVTLSTRDIMKMQTIGLARTVLRGKGVDGI